LFFGEFSPLGSKKDLEIFGKFDKKMQICLEKSQNLRHHKTAPKKKKNTTTEMFLKSYWFTHVNNPNGQN
jgi:hypothetical protein